MTPRVQTSLTPPPGLIFAHWIIGTIFLILGLGFALMRVGEFGGPVASPGLLAVTHLLILGWINLCCWGVLLQMVPVLFHRALPRPHLAWIYLLAYVPGVLGMTASFDSGRWGFVLVGFGTLAWVGIVFIAGYLAAILWKSPVRDVSTWMILTALAHLVLTATLGLILALNFAVPFLPRAHLHYLGLHAHLGMAGWLVGLIFGAGRRLLPMFFLAPEPSARTGWIAFGLIQCGLAAWAGTVFFPLMPVPMLLPACLLVAGIGVWSAETWSVFRRRARRDLDVPLRIAAGAVATVGLAAVAGFGVILAEPSATQTLAYGILALGGISLLIQSLLYKIVPFIVWLHYWSPLAGRHRTPKLSELADRTWMRGQMTFFITGLFAAAIGTAFSLHQLLLTALAFLFAAGALFLVNLLVLLRTTPHEAILPVRPPSPDFL